MISPCKDCERRHPNCHSECEDYKEYADSKKRERIKIARERHAESNYKNVRTQHIADIIKNKRK